jgi:hypothetical protein
MASWDTSEINTWLIL